MEHKESVDIILKIEKESVSKSKNVYEVLHYIINLSELMEDKCFNTHVSQSYS